VVGEGGGNPGGGRGRGRHAAAERAQRLSII